MADKKRTREGAGCTPEKFYGYIWILLFLEKKYL